MLQQTKVKGQTAPRAIRPLSLHRSHFLLYAMDFMPSQIDTTTPAMTVYTNEIQATMNVPERKPPVPILEKAH